MSTPSLKSSASSPPLNSAPFARLQRMLGGAGRVAVVGIGNELNGDDAAGVRVASGLRALIPPTQPAGSPHVLVIQAATAPESFTGPLRRFQPDLVILVDAAHWDAQPGSVNCIDWQEAQGLSASTHTLPPTLFAKFLIHELGCRVVLLGIQPQHLDFDRPVSPPVERAVAQVVQELTSLLWNLPYKKITTRAES